MPRDGSYTHDDLILETLAAARAKFTGPESWFKNGHEPWHGANMHTSENFNCIGTAVQFSNHAVCDYLMELVTGKCDQGRLLACWNNAPGYHKSFANEHRTYEDVIELLDRAIASRRAQVARKALVSAVAGVLFS